MKKAYVSVKGTDYYLDKKARKKCLKKGRKIKLVKEIDENTEAPVVYAVSKKHGIIGMINIGSLHIGKKQAGYFMADVIDDEIKAKIKKVKKREVICEIKMKDLNFPEDEPAEAEDEAENYLEEADDYVKEAEDHAEESEDYVEESEDFAAEAELSDHEPQKTESESTDTWENLINEERKKAEHLLENIISGLLADEETMKADEDSLAEESIEDNSIKSEDVEAAIRALDENPEDEFTIVIDDEETEETEELSIEEALTSEDELMSHETDEENTSSEEGSAEEDIPSEGCDDFEPVFAKVADEEPEEKAPEAEAVPQTKKRKRFWFF